jgi:hypothetical protein
LEAFARFVLNIRFCEVILCGYFVCGISIGNVPCGVDLLYVYIFSCRFLSTTRARRMLKTSSQAVVYVCGTVVGQLCFAYVVCDVYLV